MSNFIGEAHAAVPLTALILHADEEIAVPQGHLTEGRVW